MRRQTTLVPFGWLETYERYWKLLGKGVQCFVCYYRNERAFGIKARILAIDPS